MKLVQLIFICIIALLEAEAKPPNILIVVADDYGWNDVGYHGSEIKTPNIDALAGGGIKLESYYVQPVCTPTRSQLMTGRYQIHTGLQHTVIHPMLPNAVPIQFPTLANKLKDNGYSTHMIGKWHLGYYKKEYLPTNRGFDSFYGYLNGAEDYYTHRRDQLYKVNGTHRIASGLDLHDNLNPVLDQNGTYSAELFAARAEMVIKQHVSQNADKPLFLYLPFQSVHSPLQVPGRYKEPYDFIKNKERRTYAGMVAAMDEAIGNVTKAFEKYGLWDDTLMVFTTDNGGQVRDGGNNWPLRGAKTTLWEGGIRGVGFVRGNLVKERAGTSSHELIHVSDWLPTIMTAIGSSTADMKLDGVDQWKTISQGDKSARTEILHNIDPLSLNGKAKFNDTFLTNVRSAIRVGDWKLLTGDPGLSESKHYPVPTIDIEYNATDSSNIDFSKQVHDTSFSDTNIVISPYGAPVKQNVWLYNIAQDPNEKNDLSESQPDVVRHLLSRLAFYNSTAVPCRFPDQDPMADPRYHGDVWGPWM